MIVRVTRRQACLVLAGILFLTGLAGFVTAGVFAAQYAGRQQAEAQATVFSERACKQNLEALGYDVKVRGERIVARAPSSELASYAELARASVGIQSCKRYRLAEFCLGSACQPPGIEISLAAQP